jgi:DNA-binding MarR family transcriptional regulator
VTDERVAPDPPPHRPDPEADAEAEPVRPTALLSRSALTAFRLNGQFLDAAERMARPVGLTAAWWQVLGAVIDTPLPVAGIARAMGITRQSVQRIADLMVARGFAEYRPNPAHARAKLLQLTESGRSAVQRIIPAHRDLADQLTEQLGVPGLQRALAALQELSAALDAIDQQRQQDGDQQHDDEAGDAPAA